MRVAVNFTIKNPGRLKVNPVVKINKLGGVAAEAYKVSNKLTIGESEYDGSVPVTITTEDLETLIPKATAENIGGISTGYVAPEGSGNIPVQVDENGNAYVNMSAGSTDIITTVEENSENIVKVQEDITEVNEDLTEIKNVTDPLKNAIVTDDSGDIDLVNYVIIDGGRANF